MYERMDAHSQTQSIYTSFKQSDIQVEIKLTQGNIHMAVEQSILTALPVRKVLWATSVSSHLGTQKLNNGWSRVIAHTAPLQ